LNVFFVFDVSFKATVDECTKQGLNVQHLETEMTIASEKCSSKHERLEMTRRLEALKASTTKSEQAASNLRSALSNWMTCFSSIKKLQSEFRLMNGRFDERKVELGPNEINGMTVTLQRLQEDLSAVEPKCEYHMKQLTSCEVAVMDNATRCRIDLRVECENLQAAVGKVLTVLNTRKERRDKLAASWMAFDIQREDLILTLNKMEVRLTRIEVSESSLGGVEELDRVLGAVKVEIDELSKKYDAVRALGRSLITTASLEDDDEAERARQALTLVAEKWERVQRTATDLRSTVTSVILRWNLYNEAEREVRDAVEYWKKVLERGTVADSESEARQLLDTYSVR
jgi:hypothetical protein